MNCFIFGNINKYWTLCCIQFLYIYVVLFLRFRPWTSCRPIQANCPQPFRNVSDATTINRAELQLGSFYSLHIANKNNLGLSRQANFLLLDPFFCKFWDLFPLMWLAMQGSWKKFNCWLALFLSVVHIPHQHLIFNEKDLPLFYYWFHFVLRKEENPFFEVHCNPTKLNFLAKLKCWFFHIYQKNQIL